MKKIILFIFVLSFFSSITLFSLRSFRKTSPPPKILSTSKQIVEEYKKENKIKHVFVIVMENTSWSTIKDNRSAPYINSLLQEKNVSYATEYYALHHPSEPNYIWMEAGEAKGLPHGEGVVDLTSDGDPTSANSSTTIQHLVSLMGRKHLSWKVYAEGIDGTDCPMSSLSGTDYAARHVPMLFFQDVTSDEKKCSEHIRPFSELKTDLLENTVPNYSFIVPNLCDDMHNLFNCQSLNRIKNGDTWLATEIPILQEAPVFQSSALFLTWDEGSGESTTPIGMVVISPFSKGNGYHNAIHYTHSSLLRTIQDIFSLQPYLRDAKNSTGLNDLFKQL